ncbi:MAG: hypothetical protein FJX52_07025 [Alphaproteobacteria bacterium]|nr:hypothetical protein [Alphaproteobacteria bacterium]
MLAYDHAAALMELADDPAWSTRVAGWVARYGVADDTGTDADGSASPLVGWVVIFTGNLSISQREAERMAQAAGARVMTPHFPDGPLNWTASNPFEP